MEQPTEAGVGGGGGIAAQPTFKVLPDQAANFAKHWTTPGGIHVPQTATTLQFATDFANVVLRSFIEICQTNSAKAREAQKQTALVEAA